MKYLVKRHLTHDNMMFSPGAYVDLTEQQAEPLLSQQVVEVPPESAPKIYETPPPKPVEQFHAPMTGAQIEKAVRSEEKRVEKEKEKAEQLARTQIPVEKKRYLIKSEVTGKCQKCKAQVKLLDVKATWVSTKPTLVFGSGKCEVCSTTVNKLFVKENVELEELNAPV